MARYFQSERRFFAPVAPVSVLNALRMKGELRSYHLLLAHNVVAQEDMFRATLQRLPQVITIIIDNSVIELGVPVKAEVIAKAKRIIQEAVGFSQYNDIIAVLPDVLLNNKATQLATAQAIKEFRRENIDNLMFVPQGNTFAEIVECAEAFQRIEEIRWIGVARNFVEVLGSRKQITKTLQSIFPNAKFHMLGFSRDTIDDIECTKLPGVEGIDSTMPLRISTPISFNSDFPKRGNWWQENMELTDIMLHNIRQVNKWLGSP